MRHRRFPALDRSGKVGDEVRNGRDELPVGEPPPCALAVHPGAGTLPLAGVEVRVEGGNEFAFALHLEVLDVRMPDGGALLLDFDAEERLHHAEEPGEDGILREVALHFGVRIAVAGFAELFGRIGTVPGLDLVDAEGLLREVVDFARILKRARARALCEVPEEREHFRGVLRHLRGERQFPEIFESEEFGFFAAQFKNSPDDRRVVVRPVVEFRRTSGEGVVERLADASVGAVLHGGKVGRELKREPQARFAGGLRARAVERNRLGGNAGKAAFVQEDELEGVRCIKEVLAEFLRELRELLADRLHALALLFGERGARKLEVADFAADDALTHGRKRFEGVALFDPEILSVERFVLRDAQIEIGRERQRLVEGVAERRRIDDALEVPDRAPGAGKGERSFF